MPFTKSQLFKIPGITQLQHADEAYFRAIFPKDSLHYSHSWLYVLRASHLADGKLGYKYIAPDLIAIIGYRNGYTYVTPIVDMTKGIKTRQLCQELVTQTGCKIIIKKAPKELYENVSKHDPTDTEVALFEDDSNSETLLQLQRLFVSADGEINPSAKRFLRKVLAFTEQGKNIEIVDDIASIPLAQFEMFLRMDKEKYENYMPLVRYLAEQPREDSRYKYKVLVFLLDKKIRGLYITEVLSLSELGFYCGVTSKDEPGLTEWMDAFFLRKVYLEGIKTVYLGGSEKNGIAHFVKKLLPYRPEYSVKAMFFRPDNGDRSDIVVRLAREKDIKGLADLYRRFYNEMDTLAEHWTGESARKLMTHFYKLQPDLFYVAEKDNVIIGAAVAIVQPWWDGNHLLDGDVFIDSRYREQGIENKIMHALLSRARDTYKVVAWDAIIPNVKEHPLTVYKQIGFRDVPEWSSASGDTETMLALLDPSLTFR